MIGLTLAIDAGREGECADQYLVTETDTSELQREVQCGRAGAESECVRDAYRAAELQLKCVDMGAERSNPVALERLGDEYLLLPRHVGRGEVDASICSWHCARANEGPTVRF
jgi:hypothetical protein